jgi:hypothetical protein
MRQVLKFRSEANTGDPRSYQAKPARSAYWARKKSYNSETVIDSLPSRNAPAVVEVDKGRLPAARGVVRLDTARGHFPALHSFDHTGGNGPMFRPAEIGPALPLKPKIGGNRGRLAGRIWACAWGQVVAVHRTAHRRIMIGEPLPADHDCDNGPARNFGRNCARGFERAGRKRFI